MKATKTVTIIARIQFKADSKKVVYLVRGSKGEQYETHFYNGVACSCNCPATSKCYHKTQLTVIEAARTVAVVAAPVATPLASTNLDELSQEQIAIIRKEGEAKQKELKRAYRKWYNDRLQELRIDQMIAA